MTRIFIALAVTAFALSGCTDQAATTKAKGDAGQAKDAQPAEPKDGPLGMKFVPLPKGTFYMGWDGTAESLKEKEIKEDFEIAIFTVTQGQWQEIMGENPSFFCRDGAGKGAVKDIKDEDLKQFPVEQVRWAEAQEFIKKLNEKEKGKGYRYRLPSEAEWEYACRGGATSAKECSYHYYFAKPTNELTAKDANFNGNVGRTTKVGSYAPNKLGLYDMHGNVSQWCEDLWGEVRVYRGGNWQKGGFDAEKCRAGWRDGFNPVLKISSVGFRLARVPTQ